MLSNEVLKFLTELKENNNREWFNTNKARYEKAKEEFEILVSLLIPEIAMFDKALAYIEPKDCIYRIYKDVRFSHDKTPYKNYMGSYMANGGRKSPYAAYYLHLEPGNCLLAGGLYIPESPILKKVRQEIYDNTDEFIKIINQKDFKNTFKEISGEKLKTGPKDFPKDFEHIDLLKFKSYTLFKPIAEESVSQPDFMKEIISIFKSMKPFNDFMNNAIKN